MNGIFRFPMGVLFHQSCSFGMNFAPVSPRREAALTKLISQFFLCEVCVCSKSRQANLPTTMFSNDDLIEQQLAILRQIEDERNGIVSSPRGARKSPTAFACSGGHDHHATEEDIKLVDFIDNPDIIRQQRELLATICLQQDNRQLQTIKTIDDKKPAPTIDASGDRVCRLPNGKKLRIKGSLDTYKAIAEGNAALVQCPCCQTMLQIVSTAKNMLCPSCNQVSSMTLANKLTKANSSTKADTGIAKGLQRQEVDVAFARERAKIARENIMTRKR